MPAGKKRPRNWMWGDSDFRENKRKGAKREAMVANVMPTMTVVIFPDPAAS